MSEHTSPSLVETPLHAHTCMHHMHMFVQIHTMRCTNTYTNNIPHTYHTHTVQALCAPGTCHLQFHQTVTASSLRTAVKFCGNSKEQSTGVNSLCSNKLRWPHSSFLLPSIDSYKQGCCELVCPAVRTRCWSHTIYTYVWAARPKALSSVGQHEPCIAQ